jgi:hypothetical protein
MEYFLYGVVEADRIITQLKKMEYRIEEMNQEFQ